ncbi:MAG: helix-turn-helix domain-containing protein [Thermoanaerobacteraceae bacterium]
MDELGEFLKSERLKKGMSLDQLQEITKIRTRYLKAIEDGDYSVMPALVYAKGFVKSYAEALGIDGNNLVKKYSYIFEEKEEKEESIADQKVEKFNKKDYSGSFKGFKKALLFILVLGFLGYGIYYFINQVNRGIAPLPQENKQAESIPQEKTKENPVQKSEPPVQNETKTVSIEKVSETSKTIEYKIAPSSSTYKVEISIIGQKCWFSIKIDGNQAYEGLMTNNEIKEFDVKNNIDILMGYPPDVKITVDGQELPQISQPSPVTIKLHT